MFRFLLSVSHAFVRFSLAPAAAAAMIVSAAAAFADDCHTRGAHITGITERNGANCAPNCGFIIVHWSGGLDCHHFNIRERSGKQFEAAGTNRNQLANQRSAAFPGRFAPNNTIFVSVQACTKPLIGSSHCTGWSPEVSHRVEDKRQGGWGAVAANGKGFWGFAVAQASEAQARDAAVKGCGQPDCKVAIAGQNRCIAYYESRQGGYWYGLALGGTEAFVRDVALRGCSSGAPRGSCKRVKSLCAS